MRQAYVSHQHRLVVCWSPKCASTPLTQWLAVGVLGQAPGPATRGWLAEKGYTIRGADRVRDYVGRYEAIAITRDPMDRAISMFVSKFVRGYGRAMTRFENLEPFAKHTYLAATGVSAERVGVRYTGLTFLDFLRFVRERVICRSDEPNLNHHWNTQTPFTWPVEMFEAISFFDVREFRRAIQHLNARVGIQFEPPVANPTPYGSEQLAGADKVNSVDLAVLNDVPAHASFVTPESSALVAETYAIDYERLGYSPPI